jgi:hypothetical protein
MKSGMTKNKTIRGKIKAKIESKGSIQKGQKKSVGGT